MGRLPRDGVEHVWAFPSATISFSAETETNPITTGHRFYVTGATRLQFEPRVTALQADALTTKPLSVDPSVDLYLTVRVHLCIQRSGMTDHFVDFVTMLENDTRRRMTLLAIMT